MEFFKQSKYFSWWPVVFFVLIMAILAVIIVLKQPKPRQDMEFGVTFSLNFAEELGLNWQRVYDAIIDDLEVKLIRLPIYWNQIEPSPDRYDFSRFDYMLARAEQSGVQIIAVVGRRQPRWPECHEPAWAVGNSETVQQKNILFSIEETVRHYQSSPALIAWQVDNEPLFKLFGKCPPPDLEFIQTEINLVRQLDPSRPIQVTDSGELSTWLHTASLADWLGISMYRVTWNRHFGYWYYPLGPNFYKRHAQVIAPLVDRLVISELQAEPWFPDRPVVSVTLAEQYKSMNPEIFRRNIDFARRTGFDEAYLWGVEWWYWLMTRKDNPDMWQEAKALFN